MPRGSRTQPLSSRCRRRWSDCRFFVIARSAATKQSILLFRGAMDCFAALAMTEEELSRADQRQGFVAFEQIKQAAQRFAARTRQLRIFLHDAQRMVARLCDELAVHVGARDTVAGQD